MRSVWLWLAALAEAERERDGYKCAYILLDAARGGAG